MDNFNNETDLEKAVEQSAVELQRMAEFYRRHGKLSKAVEIERATEATGLVVEAPKQSHFKWLQLPRKAS